MRVEHSGISEKALSSIRLDEKKRRPTNTFNAHLFENQIIPLNPNWIGTYLVDDSTIRTNDSSSVPKFSVPYSVLVPYFIAGPSPYGKPAPERGRALSSPH